MNKPGKTLGFFTFWFNILYNKFFETSSVIKILLPTLDICWCEKGDLKHGQDVFRKPQQQFLASFNRFYNLHYKFLLLWFSRKRRRGAVQPEQQVITVTIIRKTHSSYPVQLIAPDSLWLLVQFEDTFWGNFYG